jgi:hypothetical protein
VEESKPWVLLIRQRRALLRETEARVLQEQPLNTQQHEQNALPDILMTMSQIPDVNRELAEVAAMFAVFRAARDGE